MSIFKKELKEDHVVNKTFNYSKDEVKLIFTLRVDNKSQLKDFKELLTKALEDISGEIEREI
jgi:hypothetical protein